MRAKGPVTHRQIHVASWFTILTDGGLRRDLLINWNPYLFDKTSSSYSTELDWWTLMQELGYHDNRHRTTYDLMYNMDIEWSVLKPTSWLAFKWASWLQSRLDVTMTITSTFWRSIENVVRLLKWLIKLPYGDFDHEMSVFNAAKIYANLNCQVCVACERYCFETAFSQSNDQKRYYYYFVYTYGYMYMQSSWFLVLFCVYTVYGTTFIVTNLLGPV